MCTRSLILAALALTPVLADIESLPALFTAITAGPNRRVGFLSQGNYETVKDMLPTTTTPIIFSHSEDLEFAVTNGSLVGGLVSSTPAGSFHTFSSTLVSPRAMLTPDVPANDATFRPVLEALDAAIVRVIGAGKVAEASRTHTNSAGPFPYVAVHTCKPTTVNAEFPFPSASNAAVAAFITRGHIRVGALGPYAWGRDGDYTKNPPTGFYPDYYNAISAALVAECVVVFMSKRASAHVQKTAELAARSLLCTFPSPLSLTHTPHTYTTPQSLRRYNPSGTNSFVGLVRTYYASSQGVLDSLSAGTVDTTEPYWTIDSMYNSRGRKTTFKQSCTTLGVDSTFFTTKSIPSIASASGKTIGTDWTTTIIAVVAIVAGLAIVVVIAVGAVLVISAFLNRRQVKKVDHKPLMPTDVEDGPTEMVVVDAHDVASAGDGPTATA